MMHVFITIFMLATITEESKGWNTSPKAGQKNGADEDLLDDLKKKKGTF